MTVPNPLFAWGIRFSQPTYTLRFTYNAVTEDLTFPASGTLSPTTDYFMIDDAQSDSLMQLLEDCLNSHSSGPTMNVPFTGGFKVRPANLINMSILWDHANTTLDKSIWGFEGDTVTGVAASSENVPQGLWRPGKPEMNGRGDRVSVIAGGVVTGSGVQRTSFFGQGPDMRDLRFEVLDPSVTLDNSAVSDEPYNTVESFWRLSYARGHAFRYYPDISALGTSDYTLYRANPVSGQLWEPDPQWPSGLYAADFMGRKV